VANKESQPTARELEQNTEIARLRRALTDAAARIAEQSSRLAAAAVVRDAALIARQRETRAAQDKIDRLRRAASETAAAQLATIVAGRVHLASSEAANAELELRVAERTAEIERMQATLAQSQKMEAIGQLTGGLAHDFNNLLTGIIGSLELLQTRLAQGRLNNLDRYITVAQGAAKRAATLTHRLLAFSRRQALDPKASEVNRLIAGIEDMIRRTMGPSIELEVAAGGGLWVTLIDRNQLENALLNLCINARDAMPDGGKLTIETANRWLDDRAGRERDVPSGQYVSLCVSDTGTGMSSEVAARAFDPFYTTKPLGEGTGLGLSMTYGFVRQSGGQVRIYSEIGKGTTVCLYLPRYLETDTDAEDQDIVLADLPHGDTGKTVLVVDDEPSVLTLVAEVLTEIGYTAIEASDGIAALKVLQSDVRIDLLITDVGLPNSIVGDSWLT
jgi:signal transduction histidine kinase